MADLSRRGAFALLAGAAAAPLVGCGWTVPISLADVMTKSRASEDLSASVHEYERKFDDVTGLPPSFFLVRVGVAYGD